MATNARQLIGFAVAGAIVFLIASRAMKSTALVEAPPSLADSGGAASAPTASTATETPLSEDEKADRIAFGEAMAAAAKRLSPAMTVRFAADRFTVDWETGDLRGEYFLERSYREYAKLPAADRATYIDKRAASVGAPLVPATFAEAEAHVVPLVRERISYEMARIIAAADPLKALPPEPPHRELTGELWGVLGYETPEQFVRLDAPTLSRWKVSFDDVWPAAVRRLAARATPARSSTERGMRELTFGDGNESARLLVPAVLAGLGVKGDAVVVSPREDLLLVAGSDDELALEALADRLVKEWDRGAQNMRVVRATSAGITPFVPPPNSPTRARFEDLRRSADQRDERLQREQLRRRLDDKESAPFVASVIRTKDPESGEELAFVVHTEETPSLLPRADWVIFRRVDLTKRTATTLACGPWDKVAAMMKGRWKETPFRPARWLATEHPTKKELATLGCEQPVLAHDLNVARSVQ